MKDLTNPKQKVVKTCPVIYYLINKMFRNSCVNQLNVDISDVTLQS